MNPARLIAGLVVSGLALLGTVVYMLSSKPALTAVPAGIAMDAATSARNTSVRQDEGAGAPVLHGLAQKFQWSVLESADFRQYIANLRAIGCPPETVRDLILAEVNKLFAPRELPLKPELPSTLPWEPTPAMTADEAVHRKERRERMEQLRVVQLEKQALVKELIGITIPLDPLVPADGGGYGRYEVAMAALPSPKREAVQEVIEQYWAEAEALFAKHNRARTRQYAEEYRVLNVQRQSRLAQILRPDELEEFEMRTSPTCDALRAQLAGMKPSEEEFRAIFRTRKAVEEPFGGPLLASMVDSESLREFTGNNTVAEQDRLRQEKVNEQLNEILSPERRAEYQMTQDYSFRSLSAAGDRYNLSRETVLAAFAYQREANTRLAALAADASLAEDQRAEATRQAQAELEQHLIGILGEKVYRFSTRQGSYRILDLYP